MVPTCLITECSFDVAGILPLSGFRGLGFRGSFRPTFVRVWGLGFRGLGFRASLILPLRGFGV